jgi:hypothetical protein
MEPAFECTAELRAKVLKLLEQESQRLHRRRVEELKRRHHLHPIVWYAPEHATEAKFCK